MTLTNNHRIGRFPLVYGLSLSQNFWRHSGDKVYQYETYKYEDETYEYLTWHYGLRKKSHRTTLGLAFSAHYQLLNGFGVDLTYRPSFLCFNSKKTWSYEHTISLGISWTIRLKPTYKFSIK